MRMLEYRGINLSEINKEELRYEILSNLKFISSDHMTKFFESNNNQLSKNIMSRISEFFRTMEQEIHEQEQQSTEKKEKKPWDLSPIEMENINPAKALKNTENNRTNIQALPDHIID